MAIQALEGFSLYLNTIEDRLREYYSACENEKMVSAAIDKEIDEVLLPKLKEVATQDVQEGGKPDMLFTTKTCGSKKRPVLFLNGMVFASADALDGEDGIIEKLQLPRTDRGVMEIAKELYVFIEDVKEKHYWQIIEQYAPDKTYEGVKEFLDSLPLVIKPDNIDYEVVTDKYISIKSNKTTRNNDNNMVNMVVGNWLAQNGFRVKIEGDTLNISGNDCKDMELCFSFCRKDPKDYYHLDDIIINSYYENSMHQETIKRNVRDDRRAYNAKLDPKDAEKFDEYVTDVIYGDGVFAKKQNEIYKAREKAELAALD